LDFRDAPKVFAGLTFTFEDDRFEYGEQRFITMGLLQNMTVVIVHTDEDDTIRVVSMRKAAKHEQKIYLQSLQDRLG